MSNEPRIDELDHKPNSNTPRPRGRVFRRRRCKIADAVEMTGLRLIEDATTARQWLYPDLRKHRIFQIDGLKQTANAQRDAFESSRGLFCAISGQTKSARNTTFKRDADTFAIGDRSSPEPLFSSLLSIPQTSRLVVTIGCHVDTVIATAMLRRTIKRKPEPKFVKPSRPLRCCRCAMDDDADNWKT